MIYLKKRKSRVLCANNNNYNLLTGVINDSSWQLLFLLFCFRKRKKEQFYLRNAIKVLAKGTLCIPRGSNKKLHIRFEISSVQGRLHYLILLFSEKISIFLRFNF